MGNSCTREGDVILSERGVGGAHGQRHADARGRWSVPDYHQGSIDLDSLLEAPSPSAGRRRKKKSKLRKERSRSSRHLSMGGLPPARASSMESGHEAMWERSTMGDPNARSFLGPVREQPTDDGVYHSYDDPGYLARASEPLEQIDLDCILMSPPDSPDDKIHARWGEPVDDPEESEVCTEFRPNPFKLGFCVNCQKQHDVNENGVISSEKEYKKIARPTVAKTAANAADNPLAVENLTPRNRESDVDLAALLQQRRDILSKLSKLEKDQTRARGPSVPVKRNVKAAESSSSARHTMFVSEGDSSRRIGPPGRAPLTTPQSLRMPRTAAVVVSPLSSSQSRGITKSASLGRIPVNNNADNSDEEPAQNDWF